MQPVVDAYGSEDPKGRASIDTYGLNRDRLVISRRAMIAKLISAIDNVEAFFQSADETLDPASADMLRAKGRLAFRQLVRNFLYWKNPYSAACRAYYHDWFEDFRNRVAQI